MILSEGMAFRKIKDICVGDKVIVEGGVVKTVIKTTSGTTDMYKVSQKWGDDYVVSRNHRLYLEQYTYNGKLKTSKRKKVIMTPEDYMSLSGYKKQHTFSVKSSGLEFEDKDITIPPYLLGLWLGDGRQNEFTIIVNTEKDEEILFYLGRIAEMMNLEFEIKKHGTCKSVVYFKFKKINKELSNIGVKNNKHIPSNYLNSSIETRLQLLAGIIDTDGSSDKNKNMIEIGMSRRGLVEQIRALALSCGLSCSGVMHKVSNFDTDVYRISIAGNLSIIPILIERKRFDNYQQSYTNRRCGMSIDYIGKGEYFGIQVDADNDEERRLILSDFTISMNSGKWLPPNNIENNWRVTKTCLRLGSRVIGKCMMGSTSNALSKGGSGFKDIYYDSDPKKRSSNGQTKSGLYSLFIPMEWNFEGFIDENGWPVLDKPEAPIKSIDGSWITSSVVDYWDNEVAALKGDADALNEFYRQFPRTESHAFRDESKSSLFNLTKIYQQIDYNDTMSQIQSVTRGSFHWRDGVKDSEVLWTPDRQGRFMVSWIPDASKRNRVIKNGSRFKPGNEHMGCFGCDPYDISGAVGGGGSNGSLHGLTKYHMDEGPVNEFFLEYIARPQTAEIFFEDVLMACFFYGMPILVENNKPRLLYHFKNRGYRSFAMNRPDKAVNKLSKTELELGGIPNTSEDVKQAHAAAIESYIEKHVGIDMEGSYRPSDEMGTMPFIRTLEDWARFDINNRTKHDASISSGLAIMATQRHLYVPEVKKSKISVKFAQYNNKGSHSELIK